jgi:hypothetical protein
LKGIAKAMLFLCNEPLEKNKTQLLLFGRSNKKSFLTVCCIYKMQHAKDAKMVIV